jgi:hypothetical protein
MDALTHIGWNRVYIHPMITPDSPVLHAGPHLRRIVLAVLAATALSACGGTATQASRTGAKGMPIAGTIDADEHRDPWEYNCYAGFDRDVLKIAGDEAVDCGLLRLDATPQDFADVEKCTRVAEASHRAYKVGQVGIDVGDKYIACDVAIRDATGQRWRFWYDFDLDDRLSKGASDGVVSVSRCETVAFQPGSLLTGSFFDLGGCREAPMLVASPVASGSR